MAAAAMTTTSTALLVTACAALLAVGAAAARSSCYADNTTPYLLFGSKTAYEFVYGSPTPQQITIPYCEPQQIWILSRHGTRYPAADDYDKFSALTSLRDQIIRNHEVNHEGDLCDKDLDNLRNWSLKFTPDLGEVLTKQGEDDMRLMAQRFKNRYPSLFNEGYRQDLYEFRYTNTQRTKASAEKFAEGLFGSSEGVYFPTPSDNDTLLRPYESCNAWKTMVDDNPDAKIEQTLFEEGPWMKEVIANVSKRLGFRYQLKYDNVSAIYDMCRYDKAWNLVAVSPWCAAFTDSELKVMEYKDDLRYYYKCGYGHDINVELGCSTLKDLMNHFQNLESNKTSAKGVFYFSHSSMLHMMQSRMGIAKDSEPLTHSNYNTSQKRKWRSSKIGSFATNIAAVFLKCTEGDTYRVMFYVAENVADITGCQVGLCSWDTVKAKYADIAEKCNLDFCNMNRNGTTGIHKLSWFYTLLSALIVMFLLKWH